MRKYMLPDAELSDLREAHAELRKKRDTDRVKSIIRLGSGWSATDVAKALLVDHNTIRTHYRNSISMPKGHGIALTHGRGLNDSFYTIQIIR